MDMRPSGDVSVLYMTNIMAGMDTGVSQTSYTTMALI